MVSKKTVGSLVLAFGVGALGLEGCGGEANPGEDGNDGLGGGPSGGATTGGVTTGGSVSGGSATGGSATGGISGAAGSAAGTTGLGGSGVGGAGGLGGSGASGTAGATGGVGGLAGTGATGAAGATGGIGGLAGTGATGGAGATGGISGMSGAGGKAGASGSGGGKAGAAGSGPSGVIGWAAVSGSGVTTTTGGDGGSTIIVSDASALSSNASSGARQIIHLTASVSISSLNVASNKTIIGDGNNITISGGIEINNRNNVILQNLKLNARTSAVSAGDGIRITNSHHVWIDHMEIWDAPDGNLDITDRASLITVSWTKFWYSTNPPDNNHRYSNLIGAGDNETGDEDLLNITWHHNWWADRVHERMPRVRFGDVHVFNNYYSSSGNNYCIRAGFHSNVLIESNHFQGVGKPHEIGEDQGTATVTARDNTYASTSGARDTRGTAFTPPYPYTPDPASSVASAVQSGAGPH